MKLRFYLSALLCVLAGVVLIAGCSSNKNSGHVPKKSSGVTTSAKKDSGKSTAKDSASAGSQTSANPAPLTGDPLVPEAAKGSETIAKLFGNQSNKADQAAAAKLLAPKGGAMASGSPTVSIPRPTGKQLLMALRARYASLQSLRFDIVSHLTVKQDGKVVRNENGAKTTMLLKKPDKFAIKAPQSVMMGDGKSLYEYMIPAKRYMKGKMNRNVLQAMISAKQGVGTLGLFYGVDYVPAASSMKLLNDAKINGKDTYVLSLNIKSPQGGSIVQTLWIGKNDLVICKNRVVTRVNPKAPKGYKGKVPKSIEMDEEGTLVSCVLDAKLPDSAFRFTPPAGVKLAEAPKRINLIDKPAPDFSFKWTDGTSKHLSDFHGKPVVLSIWILPQCQPLLQSLQGLYKDQSDNVQLISFDFGADAEKTSQIMQNKGYSFPVVHGTKEIGTVLQQKYGLMSLPTTVVIDANGNVKQVLMGFPKEKDLSAAIAKAK